MPIVKIVPMPGPAGTGGSGDTGDITFDGVQIIGAGDASGDGLGAGTIELVPDADLETDQYLVIDPTGPNHIHIRAGGTQDDSSADLFLGAELNNVQVSDQGREVIIRAREEDTTYTALNVNYVSGESFVLSMETEIAEGDSVLVNDVYYPVQNLVLDSPSAGLQTFTLTGRTFTSNETYTFYRTSYYSNYWRFKSDGSILFPDDTVQTTAYTGGANGDLVVPTAIKDSEGDDFITFTRTSTNTARIATPQDDLSLRSARDITLFPGSDGDGNVYIGWGDAELTPDATNRVATIGDIQSLTTGDFEFNDNVMSTEGSMSIQGMRDDSALGAAVYLDPNDGQVGLYGYSSPNTDSYSTTDWTGNATWSSYGQGASQVVLTGATALITFLNETFNQAPVGSISINGSDYYPYAGFGGNSENATIYTTTGAPQSSTTVTSLEFKYQTRSVIEISDDNEEILIEGKGLNVNLKSTEDISFTSNLDEDSEYTWAMGSNGKFRLPGDGYIENVVNGSGDESGNDTIKIVPDSNREDTDQYLIIDPTFGSPSHIHIRAGGQQDNSNADLILGGERTNVRVSDTDGTVYISSKRPDTINTYENINGDGGPNFAIDGDLSSIVIPNQNFSVNVEGTLYLINSVSYDGDNNVTTITASGVEFMFGGTYAIHESNYENYWAFEENGYLNGPAMGGLFVTGIMNPDGDLYLGSDQSIILSSGDGGEFIGDSSSADNQIATLGDIGSDTAFTVAGGTLGNAPTFNGAPLFTGSYVKTGPMVHFRIDVDFDNITSFGTGQYYLDLPFPAKYNYEFTAGCLHDISATRDYPMTGHIYAGESRMLLKSLDASGNSAFAVPFTATAPITLAVADNFHISGDYIVDTEG